MYEQQSSYEYEYVDIGGKGHLGQSLHPSDKEAVSYFRSLEENGGIKMLSLKNSTGRSIYAMRQSHSPKRLMPEFQSKIL